MNDNIGNKLMDAALFYAKLGWQVFPCSPRSKIPFKGTGGVKDATTDEATIRAWWEKWPDANIAVACGKQSGIYVVDVDLDQEKGVDGWKSLEQFDNFLPTVYQKTPRGGGHFFFKADTPPKNKNSLFNGIDIRGEGYYVMLAPSVHPNGKVYEWAEGREPGKVPLVEFPEAFRPPEIIPLAWDRPATLATKPQNTPGRSEVLARASAYLAECAPAVQGHDGHSSLLWAARALVEGFAMSDGEALVLLWTEYNPRCCPQWDQADNAQRRDFERKVLEVRKTPSGKPIGYLMEEYGFGLMTEAQLATGRESAANLVESAPAPAPEDDPDDNTPEIIKQICRKKAAQTRTIEEDKKHMPETMPEHLLQVPGFVSEVTDYCMKTAPYPNRRLAFAGALALQSFLCSRKVRDPGDIRPNIYLLALAPSGSGKDWPRKLIKEILIRAGFQNAVGDKFASGEGIEDALSRTPTKIYAVDEIDALLASIASTKNDAISRGIEEKLLTFYGAANSIHFKRDKAGLEAAGSIVNPHLIIYGTAIPTQFFAAFNERMLVNGLLARMIVMDASGNRHGQQATPIDPPESVVNIAKWWRGYNPGGDMSMVNPSPKTIAYDKQADQIMADLLNETNTNYNNADTDDEITRSVWARVHEQAGKLALIYAVSENHLCPVIGKDAAQWASAFAKYQALRMLELAGKYGCVSEFEKHCHKVLAKLNTSPDRSMPHSNLLVYMKMKAKDLRELIDTLIQRNEIKRITVPTKGAPSVFYTTKARRK